MNWLDIPDWLVYANEHGVDGFLHPSELAVLVKLAQGRNVLEIGSYRGLSAWCMAHTAKHVVCVDTFRAWTNGQTQYTEEEGFSTLADFDLNLRDFKNVARVPMSSEAAHEVIPGSFDMIFIDGDHTYEGVKGDIERWWPRVNPGGVFCVHDYGHGEYTGVKQAVDEVFGEVSNNGAYTVTLRVIRKQEDGSSRLYVADDNTYWDGVDDMNHFRLECSRMIPMRPLETSDVISREDLESDAFKESDPWGIHEASKPLGGGE